MRVLAGRRHTHRSRPVKVHVAHLIGEPLELVGADAQRVFDDVEAGRSHGSLTHALRDDEEIVTFRQSDHVVHNRTGRRIEVVVPTRLGAENFRVDALGHDDEAHF